MSKYPIIINFQNVKLFDDEAVIFMPLRGRTMAFSIKAPGVKKRFERELKAIIENEPKEER